MKTHGQHTVLLLETIKNMHNHIDIQVQNESLDLLNKYIKCTSKFDT